MLRVHNAAVPWVLAFWRWWRDEITALIPPSLRRRVAWGRGRLILVMAGDSAANLVLDGIGGATALADLDLAPERLAGVRHVIAQHARTPGRVAPVALRLPAEVALRTTMALPLAAQANLDQVVSFELDRRTPFKSDQVYYARRLLRRDAAARQLLLELTVVPREVVEESLALAGRLDLAPNHVDVAGAEPGAPPSGNLLPRRSPPLAARIPGLTIAALAGITLLLAATALLMPLYQAHRTVAALAAELADSKRQADESLALQKEIDAELQEAGFLGARKRQAPVGSAILDILTRLLPDDTWLTDLSINGGEVQLTGYAASASAVLGFVDQTKPFSNAAFRSPVTQDQKLEREQFNIGARIVPEAAP